MGVFPDFDGLGGIGDLRAIVGALLTFVLIIAVTPPYDDAVHSGVVVLVHEILARELFNLGTNGIVHVVVPEPLLDDIAGLETKFFSVL